MGKKVIYPNESGGIAVIMPSNLWDVEDVAKKDVPEGVPYLIINDSDVPKSKQDRDLWTADFSKPHGKGMGYAKWKASKEK